MSAGEYSPFRILAWIDSCRAVQDPTWTGELGKTPPTVITVSACSSRAFGCFKLWICIILDHLVTCWGILHEVFGISLTLLSAGPTLASRLPCKRSAACTKNCSVKMDPQLPSATCPQPETNPTTQVSSLCLACRLSLASPSIQRFTRVPLAFVSCGLSFGARSRIGST